jgi:hypothetical protein
MAEFYRVAVVGIWRSGNLPDWLSRHVWGARRWQACMAVAKPLAVVICRCEHGPRL